MGLIHERRARAAMTLKPFLDEYLERRIDVKSATKESRSVAQETDEALDDSRAYVDACDSSQDYAGISSGEDRSPCRVAGCDRPFAATHCIVTRSDEASSRRI